MPVPHVLETRRAVSLSSKLQAFFDFSLRIPVSRGKSSLGVFHCTPSLSFSRSVVLMTTVFYIQCQYLSRTRWLLTLMRNGRNGCLCRDSTETVLKWMTNFSCTRYCLYCFHVVTEALAWLAREQRVIPWFDVLSRNGDGNSWHSSDG